MDISIFFVVIKVNKFILFMKFKFKIMKIYMLKLLVVGINIECFF